MKTCTRCKKLKRLSSFGIDKSKKDGLNIYCNECRKIKSKLYWKSNCENLGEAHKRYNKLHQKEIKEYSRRYYQENKKKIREYRLHCRRTHLQTRIKDNLRSRINYAIKKSTKSAHTMELLGCSIEYFLDHIQKQFKPGMTWDNHNLYGWHIDHIKPCASFDLTDPEEQKKCFHYSNMQPLWQKENLSKGSRD